MPVTLNLPTLNYIQSDDPYYAEAFNAIIERIGTMQQQITTLQSQIADLQKAQ